MVDKLSQYQQKYYLCADTHNYQKTKIEMNELIIEQYITGTGGAEQDECVNPKIHNFSESKDYSDDIKENLKGRGKDIGGLVHWDGLEMASMEYDELFNFYVSDLMYDIAKELLNTDDAASNNSTSEPSNIDNSTCIK